MPLLKVQAGDPQSSFRYHLKYTFCSKVPLYMSARTKEANTPSSWARRLSGVSYSKIFPRFITITRSAVRMVWTRCCEWKKMYICYRFLDLNPSNGRLGCYSFRDIYLPWEETNRISKKHNPSFLGCRAQ